MASRGCATIEQAAALLHSLAKNHAFIDGNKRIAHLAAFVFLDVNGVQIESTEGDDFDMVMSVVNDQMTVDDVAKWLAHRARPRLAH